MTTQKQKLFYYVDKLDKQIVACFLSLSKEHALRYVYQICNDLLVNAKFAIGSLQIMRDRELWMFDFDTLKKEKIHDLDLIIKEIAYANNGGDNEKIKKNVAKKYGV